MGMIRRHRAAGFTLVEVLIALVVLSVALMGMIPMLLQSIRGNRFGRTVTETATFSQDKMEELRRMAFSGSVIGDDLVAECGAGFQTDTPADGIQRRWIVRNADGSGGCGSDLLVIEVCTAESTTFAQRCFNSTTGLPSHHLFALRARY